MTPEMHILGLVAGVETDGLWLAALALAAIVVAGAALGWRATGIGRIGPLRARLEGLDTPSAASTVGGRILWANTAMRAACGDDRVDLGSALGRGFEVDPATIYRLAKAARGLGFAFEPTRARADSAPVFLAARFREPDTLVWTVLPPERMPEAASAGGAEGDETVRLPRLHIADDGSVSANAAFAERYVTPEARADLLAPQNAGNGRQILLERHDGMTELCALWDFPADAPGGEARNVLVLPLDGDKGLPSARTALEVVPVALMQLDQSGRVL